MCKGEGVERQRADWTRLPDGTKQEEKEGVISYLQGFQRRPAGVVGRGRWAKNKVHTREVWEHWAYCTHMGQDSSGISPGGPRGRM